MKSKIKIDFADLQLNTVNLMQADAFTRQIEATMLENGEPYDPATEFGSGQYGFRVDYVKPVSGIRGRYETIQPVASQQPTQAVTQSGNVLTVEIAPQVLTVSGKVIMNIVIYNNTTAKELRSFPVVLNVQPAAVPDAEIPEDDYWDVKSLADVTAILQQLEEEIAEIQEKKRICCLNQDVPTDDSTVLCDEEDFQPVPILGDVIVGTNGYMGYVSAVEKSGITVTGFGAKMLDPTTQELDAEKADKDGEYDEMIVGLAKNLQSTVGVTDTAPYNFRTSGGSLDVGERMKLKKLVGMTLGWNQLSYNPNFSSTDGWTGTDGAVSVADNVAYISKATSGYISFSHTSLRSFTAKAGHKFLITGLFQVSSGKIYLLPTGASAGGLFTFTNASTEKRISIIWSPATDATCTMGARFYATTQGTTETITGTVKKFCCFDLTEIFGATIADYINTLENGTAGAGVAWITRYLPKLTAGYYAYDPGSLQSVRVSARKAVGFNAYKHSAGTAKLVGGMQYQITGDYTALSFTPDGGTAAAISPDASGKFTPEGDGILSVTGGSKDTCVHLVWDGEKDGEFAAYSETTYALDGEVELRGIPALDENNNLVADGDEYKPDGTGTRKYWFIDLGANKLDWTYDSSAPAKAFKAALDVKTPASNNDAPKLMAIGYRPASIAEITADLTLDNVIGVYNNTLWIRNLSYSDAASFAEAMSGKILLYEMETATTLSADPYAEDQIVDNWGTEELVDAGIEAGTRDVAIPCGTESWYPVDLRAKLETLPNVPGSNGDYVLDVDDGDYSYKSLAQAAVIAGLLARCPAWPTTDGTYTLQVTVANGEGTASWVAVT